MAKLEHSEKLGRPIRQEDWPEITISTPEMIKRALAEGRRDEALALLDYLAEEKWVWNDHAPEILAINLTWVADNLGEDALEQVLREIPERIPTLKQLLMPDVGPRELLDIVAEQLRALRVPMTIREEPDRYVVESNPCNTCGRLRRMVEQIGHDLPTAKTTREPHDWSWGRAGVPYYCALSCLWNEILPIEQRGFPTMVTDWDPDPTQPCRKYIYKDPALIPEEFYRRVGRESEGRGDTGTRGRGDEDAASTFASSDPDVSASPPLRVSASPRPPVPFVRSTFLTAIETWPELGREYRVIRNDERVEELAMPTEELIRGAIQEERDEDAAALLDYLFEESQLTIEHIHEEAACIWTWVQERYGEEMLGRIILENFDLDEWAKQHQNLSHKSAPMTMREYAQFHEGEHKRGLHYGVKIAEEPDRFAVTFDPCGTGQRMRRKGTPDGKLPAFLGRTQQAHPWSFGRAGVPLWCCRCSASEYRKLRTRGYMTMVTDYNPDGFQPCMRYLYKDPADIPERFFHRAGFQKRPEEFRIIGRDAPMKSSEHLRLEDAPEAEEQ